MRLAALGLVALLLAGCVSQGERPAALPAGAVQGAAGLVVHQGLVAVPRTAEQALGGVPHVVERLLGQPGAEPNIGVTSSGALFVSAFDDILRSRDQGRTWERVYEFGSVHPSNASRLTEDPVSDADPMLWVDPQTDRVFAPLMFPLLLCAEGLWSDDEGATWHDRPMDCGLPGNDHQKLATGPYAKDSPLLPLKRDYPNVVYYCYNNVRAPSGATDCAVSTDGGETFPLDQQVDQGCGGLNGHPATARDGTVYVPFGAACHDQYVAVSKDNGVSWDALRLHTGGLGGTEDDADMTVTPDGTAYYLFQAGGQDHRTWLLRSKDGFRSVDGPFLVSPPGIGATRFGVITSGDDGRIAVAYLGTPNGSAPNDAADSARWNLYVTFSFDAASANPTFVTTQATNDSDPIQIGYMWESGGGDPARNLLDFFDMVTDKDGRVYVSLTDGCTKDCAGNATATKEQSRSRDAAVAVLDGGPLLRAHPVDLRARPAATDAGFPLTASPAPRPARAPR